MGGYGNGPYGQPAYGGQEYTYNYGQPMVNQPYGGHTNPQPFGGPGIS